MHGRSGEQRLARQTSLRPSGTGGTVGRGMLCGSFVSARTGTRSRRWRSSSAGRGPAAMCGNSRIDRCTENPSKNAIRTLNLANGSNIVAGTSVTAVYDNLSFTIQSVPGPIVGNGHGLHPWEAEVIRLAGAFADRLVLASNPAVQACRRMRLPADYLYVHPQAVP